MPLKLDKMRDLERRVLDTIQGKTPLLDIPYYICIHNPQDELDIIDQFSNLVLRFRRKGFSAEIIKLSKLMVDILEEEGFLSQESVAREEEFRSDLEDDLRRILLERIVNALKEHLGGKDVSHCAVLLRYGALRPFVHLSNILQSIEGTIHCTLLISYPSSIGEGYPLDEENNGIVHYYRAEVVDLR